jgi:flagellar protein FlgJ
MTSISNHLTAASSQTLPTATSVKALTGQAAKAKNGHSAEEVREHFTQFVGETFYSQMLKSMRQTVGKPAYFDGGRGEEVFRGQLDQQMAQELAKSSARQFADPMFARQFPSLAKELAQEESESRPSGFQELSQLSRR